MGAYAGPYQEQHSARACRFIDRIEVALAPSFYGYMSVWLPNGFAATLIKYSKGLRMPSRLHLLGSPATIVPPAFRKLVSSKFSQFIMLTMPLPFWISSKP